MDLNRLVDVIDSVAKVTAYLWAAERRPHLASFSLASPAPLRFSSVRTSVSRMPSWFQVCLWAATCVRQCPSSHPEDSLRYLQPILQFRSWAVWGLCEVIRSMARVIRPSLIEWKGKHETSILVTNLALTLASRSLQALSFIAKLGCDRLLHLLKLHTQVRAPIFNANTQSALDRRRHKQSRTHQCVPWPPSPLLQYHNLDIYRGSSQVPHCPSLEREICSS